MHATLTARPLHAALLLTALVGCAPPADPLPITGDGAPASRLATCLLEGGALTLTTEVSLDVAIVTAIDVAANGDVVLGEFLGAVNVAPDFVVRSPGEVVLEIMLPAGGRRVQTIAASSDDHVLVSADEVGQIALWDRTNLQQPKLWQRVRYESLRAAAATADGRVAWVDAAYSGTPTLWDPAEMVTPESAPTTLWNAWTTSFYDDDRRWLVAGDWYGVPQIEVHDLDAPGEEPVAWLGQDAIGGGVVTVAIGRRDGTIAFAGPRPFDDTGFVGVLDPSTGRAATYPTDGHRPRLGALLPGGRVLLTVGEEARVIAWDLTTGQALASHAVPDYAELSTTDGLGIAELVAPLAVHADGVHLLIGDRRGVQIFACE